MNSPILSIIIINYNTSDITVNCLKSIYSDKGLRDIPYEIILVDNNSTDDSLLKIQKLQKPINIIANKNNVGFGKANNQAFQVAKGNYLLLLNSDTLILHSAISQSLLWLCSHPESYGCTAQLLNADKTIQASGGFFPNLFNIATWCTGLDDLPFTNLLIKPFHPHTPNFYTHDNYYLKDHPQDWVTGAFTLLRKEVVDKVSGFNSDFFMYGEEMEMCFRIHQKFPKQSLWYLVGPQIIHFGGASSKNKQIIFDREYEGIISFFKIHRPSYELSIVRKLLKINQFLQLHVYRLLKHV